MAITTSKAITDQVLRPLATSLALQEWTRHAIEQHLEQRVPGPMRRHARAMAEGLIQSFPAAVAPDAARITQHLQLSDTARALRQYARRHGGRATTLLESASFRPAPCFADCGLPALTTEAELAEWLAIPADQLVRFSDCLGLSARAAGPFAGHYRHHLRAKSDGALRLLEEPKPVLKTLQRQVLKGLLNKVPPHPAAYGFCVGRNAIQAAACHAGEAMVVSFDLASFFPSISQHRVYALFRRMGYPAAVARHLTGLCTAITPPDLLATPKLAAAQYLSNRHVPQGAPTSPAIANLVAYGLDVRLDGLARRLDARYTRYADDLTFSGDTRIARILERAVPEIVSGCGFALNPAKTRVQPAAGRQCVTGIVVNQHLNVARPDYDRLKATVHHLKTGDPARRQDPAYLAHLMGRIDWLEQLNPSKGLKLRERLAQALSDTAKGGTQEN